jgi:hypothetical protein
MPRTNIPTPKQYRVLVALKRLHDERGQFPTVQELADELGIGVRGTHDHLVALKERGWIEISGKPRGFRVLRPIPPDPEVELEAVSAAYAVEIESDAKAILGALLSGVIRDREHLKEWVVTRRRTAEWPNYRHLRRRILAVSPALFHVSVMGKPAADVAEDIANACYEFDLWEQLRLSGIELPPPTLDSGD